MQNFRRTQGSRKLNREERSTLPPIIALMQDYAEACYPLQVSKEGPIITLVRIERHRPGYPIEILSTFYPIAPCGHAECSCDVEMQLSMN